MSAVAPKIAAPGAKRRGRPIARHPPPGGTTSRGGAGDDHPRTVGSAPHTPHPHGSQAGTTAFIEFLEKYQSDPVAFAEEVLGAKPKKWQREFLTHVANGKRRISIKAGHGVGKSTAVAWVLIWSIICRLPQKSVVTAPTAPQLFDALFAELKSWITRLPPPLKALLEVYSDRIELKADPDGSFISARTSSSDKPEAMAGIHSENVLLIADEASGIPESVYEAATGSMSGHSATTVLVGNPTRLTGLFYKSHNELADRWERMTVSCLDPDLADLVDQDFVQQVAETWGEDSPQYSVRVLGEFPRTEDNSLIPVDLVDAAMKRDVVLNTAEPLVFGVDVARFGGDRSVICKRQGNVVLEFQIRSGNDLMETVGWVANEAMKDKPAEILVDSIGLGAGVADRLRELKYNVRDVNVAESAAMNPQASRLRDELWLTLRDWLQQRACKLPKVEELRVEISAPLYKFNSNGTYKIESKDEMRKRIRRSPDIADSLCLTFAGDAALVGGRGMKWVPGQALKRGLRGIV